MKSARRYIQCRQHNESWQPFLICGGYPRTGSGTPARTGHCRLRKPTVPCLFRRSTNSHQIRWNRTNGERSN